MGFSLAKKADNEEVIQLDQDELMEVISDCRDYIYENFSKLVRDLEENKENKFVRDDLKLEIEKFLKTHKTFNLKGFNEYNVQYAVNETMDFILGYGVLDKLIKTPGISDIKVMNHEMIRAKCWGIRYTTKFKFKSPENLKRYFNFVCQKNNTNTANSNAVQSLIDITTYEDVRLRMNVTTEYVNTYNPCLHIRVTPNEKRTFEELKELGVLSETEVDYLKEGFNLGLSIFFTGSNGSGKSTLLNSGLEEIPHQDSVLVIQQDSEDLFCFSHPEMVFQQIVKTKGESTLKYEQGDLIQNGLLTDNTTIVIGEIKGGEARYFITAANTGSNVYATGHGASCEDGLYTLSDYIKRSSDYSQEETLALLKNIDIIVFTSDFEVKEICEIEKFDYDTKKIKFNRVFENHIRINESCERIKKKKEVRKISREIKEKRKIEVDEYLQEQGII